MRNQLLPLLSALFLAACASDDPHHAARQQSQERAEAMASSGYRAEQDRSLTVALQQWVVSAQVEPVALAFPSSGAKLPLIVYVPGLGESAQAGSRWRETWARAGYAVLSVQPLAFDATAWQSDLARDANFKGLARAHRAPALQAQRTERLAAVMAEARRRAASGDSLWSRVDFDTVVMAGYDIGSLTAAESAGGGVKALMLLSPMPLDVAVSAQLSQPLLMVGSRRDDDLIGLVATPDERTAGFVGLPAGHKHLLLLEGASHALLSGAAGQEDATDGATAVAAPQGGRSARGGGAGGGGAGGGGGRHGGGGGAGAGGQGMGGGGQGRGHDAPRGNFDTGGRAQAQAIATVSTAFLDAELRGSRSAREWLDHEAAPWLRSVGQWQQR